MEFVGIFSLWLVFWVMCLKGLEDSRLRVMDGVLFGRFLMSWGSWERVARKVGCGSEKTGRLRVFGVRV